VNAPAAVDSKLPTLVQGSVMAVDVQPGQSVAAGAVALLLESMKLEDRLFKRSSSSPTARRRAG